jgi:hypothetical protein
MVVVRQTRVSRMKRTIRMMSEVCQGGDWSVNFFHSVLLEELEGLEDVADPVLLVVQLDRVDDLVGVSEGHLDDEEEHHQHPGVLQHQVEPSDVEVRKVQVLDLVEKHYET